MNKKFITKIKKLKIKIDNEVKKKLKEFEGNFSFNSKQKFIELCFCILVANTSIKKTLEVWERIYKNFLLLPESKLRKELKRLGYRFYNKRAHYIVSARKFIKGIDFIIKNKRDLGAREWLAKNIKGIGWKESSHFLRNIGFKNFSILDRHVLKVLLENKVINKIPKSLSKKQYLKTEESLRNISNYLNCNLAELDLYLFYLDTGKISPK